MTEFDDSRPDSREMWRELGFEIVSLKAALNRHIDALGQAAASSLLQGRDYTEAACEAINDIPDEQRLPMGEVLAVNGGSEIYVEGQEGEDTVSYRCLLSPEQFLVARLANLTLDPAYSSATSLYESDRVLMLCLELSDATVHDVKDIRSRSEVGEVMVTVSYDGNNDHINLVKSSLSLN